MIGQRLREIHRYWFGELKQPGDFRKETGQLWFRPSAEVDTHIRDAFGPVLVEAAEIDWKVAGLSREEQIGLIVLFDQFPRNIFRESAEAFAYDGNALNVAKQLVGLGTERLFPLEVDSLSLVFQHQEDSAAQDYSVWLAAGLAVSGPPNMLEFYRVMLDFATKHRDIIRRFGRYPHRNSLLGRPSTPEEIEFLKGGRGF
jgi:uncharacterized protein (DUF924 family)